MREERSLARVAARQHGAITTAQLRSAGLSDSGIGRRLKAGRLHRVHRGIYAVGHPALSIEGRWMAAVLACGPHAALSHRSAAQLWGLLARTPGAADVCAPATGGRRPRSGIRVHRSSSLSTNSVTRRKNIPVTTPARTVADLRPVASAEQLRRVLRQAAVLGLDIDSDADPDPTRSELERRFLRICTQQRLPAPEVNVSVGAYVVDFLWRSASLIAETDGYRFHRGRQAFEDDRARDLALRLMGYEVLRFTFRQVTDEPASIAVALRRVLGSARLRTDPATRN